MKYVRHLFAYKMRKNKSKVFCGIRNANHVRSPSSKTILGEVTFLRAAKQFPSSSLARLTSHLRTVSLPFSPIYLSLCLQFFCLCLSISIPFFPVPSPCDYPARCFFFFLLSTFHVTYPKGGNIAGMTYFSLSPELSIVIKRKLPGTVARAQNENELWTIFLSQFMPIEV